MDDLEDHPHEIDWPEIELLWEIDRARLACYLRPHMLDELKVLLDAMSSEVREEVVCEALRAAPVYGDHALIVAVARVYDRRRSRHRAPSGGPGS